MESVTRVKPGLAYVGGIFRNYKGEVLYMFSKYGGIKDFNEEEVLVILKVVRICASHG